MEDLRKRMTRKLLYASISSLMQKKPIEKITVTEICRQAQINRTTFYLYYKSPYELKEDMLNSELSETYARFAREGSDGSQEFRNALQYMLDNPEQAMVFMQLRLSLIPGEEPPMTENDFTYHYLTDGCAESVKPYAANVFHALCRHWLMLPEESRMPVNDFASLCERLSMAMSKSLQQ